MRASYFFAAPPSSRGAGLSVVPDVPRDDAGGPGTCPSRVRLAMSAVWAELLGFFTLDR
jgi:hypothetical protein